MPWTKNDYPDSVKNLDIPVRYKAIEIANRLVEDGYEEGRAISIAISQSKDWYEKRGENVSSEITHHLVPREDDWIIIRRNKVTIENIFIFSFAKVWAL